MALAETAQLLVNLVMKADVTQLAKANTTIGQTQSSVVTLGKAILPLAGAAGFGLLTKGALEAEAAQGKFMAATGQSRDAAKQFVSGMDSLAGSAGAVGVSFDQITRTGTEVAQQFGTTGQKTVDLTNQILDFSKVTGVDSVAATKNLDDTLAAFNLTSADAKPLLDDLVASQQKYGTDAQEALPTLQKMAPAFEAMGLSASDASGFLNLMEVSGLDASKATVALNTAVKKLQPGQDLNDLIAQIASIQDPTLRAQEAMKIFGTRAGTGLANAIKPGVTSLDQFKVSVTDAADANQNAAQDMETTGDKIRGVFDKLGAGARELGQQFGPAVTGLASLASLTAPLIKTFGGLIGDVAKAIIPKAVASGTLVGAAEGEAETEAATGTSMIQKWLAKFGLGTAAKVGAATAAGALEGEAEGTAAAEGMGGAEAVGAAGASGTAVAGGFLATLTPLLVIGGAGAAVLMLPQIIDHLTGQDATSKIAGIGKAWADSTLTGYSDQIKTGAGDAFEAALQASLAAGNSQEVAATAGHDAAMAYLDKTQATISDATTTGDAFGLHAAWTLSATLTPSEIAQLAAPAAEVAQKQADEYKATVQRNQTSLSLWDITKAKQQADQKIWEDSWNQSALAITGDLVGTLKGAKDNIGNAMDELTYAINHPLDLEKNIAKVKAQLASKELADGLASNNTEIRTTAEQTKQKLTDIWYSLDPAAKAAAERASSNLSDNLSQEYPSILRQARSFVSQLNAEFADLKTKYNINVNTAGTRFGGAGLRAEGGPVVAGQAYIVGEHRAELFIPDANGRVIPSVPPLAQLNRWNSGGVGAVAVTVNLSTREFNEQEKHYAVIQAGGPAFSSR